MTAISACTAELRKIQKAMNACMTPDGHIKKSHLYRYSLLMKKSLEFKKSIDWLREQNIGTTRQEVER